MSDDDRGVGTYGYEFAERILLYYSLLFFLLLFLSRFGYLLLLSVRIIFFLGIRADLRFLYGRLLFRSTGILGTFCKFLIHLLEERHVVVELLHRHRRVDVEGAVAGYGMTILYLSVLVFGTTCPVVCRIICTVGIEPVEDRHHVQRQLEGCGELLVVVEWGTQVLDALPNGVLPNSIVVGSQVFVYLAYVLRLFNLCACSTLEREMQVLCQVPT